jgi:hypothetical protein
MKNGYEKSTVRFFRLIGMSAGLLLLAAVLASLLVPAPLQPPADPGLTPNPAKSAWFLLWIQELVSWSKWLIYPVLLLAAVTVMLPWLPERRLARASWFPREQFKVNLLAMAFFLMVVGLTVVAYFFRGENWQLLF